jgi:enoyl-CoA hydratase/carnithine racemase
VPVIAALNGHTVGAAWAWRWSAIGSAARGQSTAPTSPALGHTPGHGDQLPAAPHHRRLAAARTLVPGRLVRGEEAERIGADRQAVDAGDVLPARSDPPAPIAAPPRRSRSGID